MASRAEWWGSGFPRSCHPEKFEGSLDELCTIALSRWHPLWFSSSFSSQQAAPQKLPSSKKVIPQNRRMTQILWFIRSYEWYNTLVLRWINQQPNFQFFIFNIQFKKTCQEGLACFLASTCNNPPPCDVYRDKWHRQSWCTQKDFVILQKPIKPSLLWILMK